jgi:hypothetical protein
VLAAWTDAAVGKLREKWGDEEDEEAVKNPNDAAVQQRLKDECDAISSEVGSLEDFREKCATSSMLLAPVIAVSIGSACHPKLFRINSSNNRLLHATHYELRSEAIRRSQLPVEAYACTS